LFSYLIVTIFPLKRSSLAGLIILSVVSPQRTLFFRRKKEKLTEENMLESQSKEKANLNMEKKAGLEEFECL